ncbi:alpha/beta hydrolase [Pararhizobium sp. PWRC1-1]|uniref:alpha/beta hydrolase n=1 Tax=Pararhizobium sp. PWRC1-1 TaxID=2804566 RepID=UPI003CF124DD
MIGILGLHGSSQHPAFISEFLVRLAPERQYRSPKGPFADGDGFTFFKRRTDRSIPLDEIMALARQGVSADGFVTVSGLAEILLVGYSSGAIFSSALLAVAPERFVGAILLRPQPISDDFTFPELSGKPVLIISGLHDERREPQHASRIAEQLTDANAALTHHQLDAGHAWSPDNRDLLIARTWLDENFPPSSKS